MMRFQGIEEAKKPLASVAGIVTKGNRIVMDDIDSYIENKIFLEVETVIIRSLCVKSSSKRFIKVKKASSF